MRLRAGIAMFAQIRGSNYLRLIPDYLCEMHCATIEFELKQGEICKYWVFVHFNLIVFLARLTPVERLCLVLGKIVALIVSIPTRVRKLISGQKES